MFEEVVGLRRPSPKEGEEEDFTVTIQELPLADGVHASTGCQLWPASIILARELLRRPELLKNRRTLEVGCGCGLAGIVAATLASQCIITDGDEEVVQLAQRNLLLNWPLVEEARLAAGLDLSDSAVSTEVFRWESAIKEPYSRERRVEVVLASDVIYGQWGDTLAEAVNCILSETGEVLLVASEDRRSGAEKFIATLRKMNFHLAETKLMSELGEFRIFECRRCEPGSTPVELPLAHRSTVAEVGAE